VTCRPERVTAWVDEALPPEELAEVAAHLAECPACRAQADAERALRARLRTLPSAEPRPELLAAVRTRIAAMRRPRLWTLSAAAALALVLLWARGASSFVAWELARDHDHCFGMAKLPARFWSGDATEVARWLESQGTEVPPLPAGRPALPLVGARYCPLLDRVAAHVYYAGEERQLSLFVLSGPVRFSGEIETHARGRVVRLLRSAGSTLALVADREEDVKAFRDELVSATVRLEPARLLP
jgi:hypothetical protein